MSRFLKSSDECGSARRWDHGVVVAVRIAITGRRHRALAHPQHQRLVRAGLRTHCLHPRSYLPRTRSGSASAGRRTPRRPQGCAVNPDARPWRGTVIYRWGEETANPTAGARAALSDALTAAGVEGEAREDAQLALSELVANAAEHAQGPYEVRLRMTAETWVCEVADGDTRLPRLSAGPPSVPFHPEKAGFGGGVEECLLGLLEERGRGLRIVDYLTRGAWGFRVSEAAKVVWFAIPGCPPRPCGRIAEAPGHPSRSAPMVTGE
ncbi:ATP-binding protein [Streptomyces armeniacus]|uniref:ATP-binding protein n=2 Tax=Streptomyces armeniacus TaxID=83291 RepID=A0A345XW45_9ACTN|nr:ATP-binding protein [Streptomyces armeniacus]AXK35861.1 ATP-binding protein [Streptomyces armeniacus]